MCGRTEPFEVILALRALDFSSPAACTAWLNHPNADLGGVPVSMAVLRGQYDDAIRAIALEVGRRSLKRYHPGLVEEEG